MEDSSRLHAGLGGDNEKLAFGVLQPRPRRATTSAAATDEPLDLADLGLRFDLTVPLARFYATHRAELPAVFRAIQIAPVWRAERPQKGRYRQFVQCDIDIIGEAGPLRRDRADHRDRSPPLDALGLERLARSASTTAGSSHGMLDWWGIAAELRDRALITIDKLDKIGADGVAAELASRVRHDRRR